MAANRAGTIGFTVRGPIERDDVPAMYDRICTLLEESGAGVAICEVDGVAADVVTAEALARLQLAARRHGCQVRLHGTSAELRALIAFMGLRDVLPEASPYESMRGGRPNSGNSR
jgi:ABC-type transporter Mla MlaB component